MDEVKTSKTVKEVFKDYNSNSFVLNAARVIGIDLYKKKNLLEVFIASNKLIDINDVLELEKYMERRFQIQTAKLTIKYELEEEVDVSEKIAKEWQSIVKYISYKHPIARAFLNNSEIQIVNNNIKVTLFLNGKEFLESNKFNEVFAGLIYNIYGKKYTMTYEEKVSESTVTQYKERLERLEKEAILEMTKDNGTASAEHSEKQQQETKPYASKNAGQSKYNKGQYSKSQYNKGQYGEKKQYNKSAPNPAQEAPMPPMPDAPEAVATPEEDTPLIYGRSLNLSDPIIKIQDIGVDSGNVILEGQILSVELDAKDDDINLGIKVRELKSGKSLVIFSVYDGTNTIDCKVFSAPENIITSPSSIFSSSSACSLWYFPDSIEKLYSVIRPAAQSSYIRANRVSTSAFRFSALFNSAACFFLAAACPLSLAFNSRFKSRSSSCCTSPDQYCRRERT